MTDRLKDPRTWAIITTLINALLAYLKVDPQITIMSNLLVALIAFLLFGVEPVVNAIKAARARAAK